MPVPVYIQTQLAGAVVRTLQERQAAMDSLAVPAATEQIRRDEGRTRREWNWRRQSAAPECRRPSVRSSRQGCRIRVGAELLPQVMFEKPAGVRLEVKSQLAEVALAHSSGLRELAMEQLPESLQLLESAV